MGGLIPVAAADVAAVVTTLEMRTRPRPAPLPESPLRLVKWISPTTDRYRTLFRRVGEPWLWFSRLVLSEQRLAAIIDNPAVEVFAVIDRQGVEVGMLELDFRTPGACEIAYFGLIPDLAGRGHGRWLMARALAAAWRADIMRVWLHTCSLDHPSALNFYRAQGFMPVSRTIETFADPRVTGVLAVDAAPQIPRLAASRR